MKKILLVEDDKYIAEEIFNRTKMWDMDCLVVEDFKNVLSTFREYDPSIVLLDISLPFYDGYYWCREIRKISKVPIIFISSKNDDMNMIMAMNIGADDFVAKPFSFDLLIAKIEALLRRTYDFNIGTSIAYKDYVLNLGDSSLSYKDKRIILTSNEQKILKCLFEHKGNVVSREKLMNVLWDTDCYIDDNTLTVNINRLRKKCFELSNEDFIKTRVKQGYIVE